MNVISSAYNSPNHWHERRFRSWQTVMPSGIWNIHGRIKYIDFIIVLTTLLIGASPFFINISVLVPFTFMLIIGIYAFSKGKLRKNNIIFHALMAVYALIIIQWVLFGGISPAGIYKPLTIFFTPFIIYRLLGLSFFKYLFWIIYYGAIFTFPFWVLQLVLPSFSAMLQKVAEIVFPYNWDGWPRSLLFYTVSYLRESSDVQTNFLRNCGFFHEPGAFSLYLMLAIIINTMITRKTLERKNIILAIILLTTFSTAGYILLTIFLTYSLIKSKIHSFLKGFVLLLMIILTINAYRSENFLQKKIQDHYSNQSKSIQKNEADQGRFFAFFKAIAVLKQNFLFGKGIIEANRPVGEQINSSGFGWGFMGFFANYGILFGIFYLFYYYKGLKIICLISGVPKGLAILFFIIIHAGLSTQAFFFHASFVMFFIIGLQSNVNVADSMLLIKPMLYKK